MIDDYEEKNREQTIAAVDDFGGERLQEFVEFEREHKNRTTVVKPLDRQLLTVTPAVDRQYVAGVWFDTSDTELTVRRTPRIERALDDGRLQEV